MAILDSLPELLPQGEGWLPTWQLIVAIMAVFNTAQNFATIKLTRRLYNTAPVTPLQARTFAIWTLTSAAIRLYAAYNINVKQVYDLALFSYLFAFGHFGSEIFFFGTAKLFGPVLSSVIVSTASLAWMVNQYHFYVHV
ncbi:Erg28-like protein [Daedalea quercina L-15889]|uniref:Erg28-like protein n=1 Tax=Daedalea quercina L-15889 TaxID=1314783 RepID=A0A165TAG8_9APHY|nr:Erg28-like protein [Daedalea quercina L-15889]